MQVTYFPAARSGPEALIETAIIQNADCLVSSCKNRTWAAASLPIGAGKPDVLIVTGRPQVMLLAACQDTAAELLGYLAAVGRATYSTLVGRFGPRVGGPKQVELLLSAKIVRQRGNVVTIRPSWRNVLPEIISIEAKVRDWRKALQQATRNRIFTHRSYVALPSRLAERVSASAQWRSSGVGLLSVTDAGVVKTIVPAKLHKPQVWFYYYRIASAMARSAENHAVYGTSTRRPSAVSAIHLRRGTHS